MATSKQHTRLTTFDRCHDADDPDGILVVLDVLDTVASECELTPGVTVANIHDGYPPGDPVVVCAYERRLDVEYPEWRHRPPSSVGDSSFGKVSTRYLPASKLDRYDAGNFTDLGDTCRCEHCKMEVDSIVEHLVRDCQEV